MADRKDTTAQRRRNYALRRSTPEGDAHYKELSRNAYKRRKQAVLAQQRLKTYGISEGEYDQMMIAQNGCCAICGKPETVTRDGHVRNLSIDHCHKTGKVRGLLCSKHNAVLGLVDEDTGVLEQMIAYLKAHKT